MLYKVVQKLSPKQRCQQSIQCHTSLTHHFFIFHIQAVWGPGLSTRLPEYQNLAMIDGLDWYAMNALLAPLLEAVIWTTLYNII